MPTDHPLWFRAFDAAESAVAPRLEAFLRTGTFAGVVGVGTRAQAGVRRELERRTRRLWHLANLPAGSDVTLLRRQLAGLERDVRTLSAAVERALAEQDATKGDEDVDGGEKRPARARRAAGPRPAGRRAQRAARS